MSAKIICTLLYQLTRQLPLLFFLVCKEEILINDGKCQTVCVDHHRENKTPFFRILYTCFGSETKTGVVCILVIFLNRPMFSHINRKLSLRPFE